VSVMLTNGDALAIPLADNSVHCVVTSPPYWGLRDYQADGQLGLEATPGEYIQHMVQVFREVRRVLRDDGTLWLNLGDTYANDGKWGGESSGKRSYLPDSDRRRVGREKRTTGMKPKDLVGIPWRVAFALQEDGWYLRSDIIWHKPNPMPESVRDRPTKSHEHLFLLAKSEHYYYDADAIAEQSVTGDPRRPYGSQGAWEMDGRPDEQQHGGELRASARFGRNGKTTDYVIPGQRAAQHRQRQSVPRGGFNGKTNELPGREAFRAITQTRNKRDVWTIPTQPYPGSHFATFPPGLVEPCVLAGTSARGCCPKCGAPWERAVAVSGRAMAFPDTYVVLGNKRQQVRQFGNAVTPPVMEMLMKRCMETLR
jgi:DNA modification methylase